MNNRFAPITFSWGFVDAPLRETVETFSKWQKSAIRTPKVSRFNSISLSDGLEYLQPLDYEGQRSLFISTRSKWTAYFENNARGSQPGTVIGYLCEQMKCSGLTCSSIPTTLSKNEIGKKHGTWGAVEFKMYAPHRTDFLNLMREVSLRNDVSGWTFAANGEIQPFESSDAYSSKRNVDKFSTDMLEDYFRFFGIDLFSDEFYGGESIVVWSYYWFLPRVKKVSLLEAQKALGIVD